MPSPQLLISSPTFLSDLTDLGVDTLAAGLPINRLREENSGDTSGGGSGDVWALSGRSVFELFTEAPSYDSLFALDRPDPDKT